MWRALIVTLIAGCGAKTGLGAPSIDAGVRDAGTPDAFALDRGPIDAPRCDDDRDCDDRIDCTEERCVEGICEREAIDRLCDDGLFCNGVDRCVLEVGCAAETIVCGDGFACTSDRCDEPTDRCVFDPNSSLCPVSHRCDPFLGCVARALVHDASMLFEIDLPSGDLHVLGPTPIQLLDLALDADGTLYGATSGALVRVDYVAMTFETVASVSGVFNALDIGPDGVLYGARDDQVVRFDLASGDVVTVARFPDDFVTSGDLAFVEGELYATVADTYFSPRPDSLARIDIARGTAEFVGVVGSVGHRCTYGLAPFGATLYAMTCDGKLLSIDTNTGRGTLLRTTSTGFWGAGAR